MVDCGQMPRFVPTDAELFAELTAPFTPDAVARRVADHMAQRLLGDTTWFDDATYRFHLRYLAAHPPSCAILDDIGTP